MGVEDNSDAHWMRQALNLAEQASMQGEVPVGAIVVCENAIIGEGWNQPISSCDPTAHAEIIALRAAATVMNNYRIPGATLYVTLEPCMMCAGAMVHARIQRLVCGASDPKRGASNLFDQPGLNHRVEVTGDVLAVDCGDQLKAFFRDRRA